MMSVASERLVFQDNAARTLAEDFSDLEYADCATFGLALEDGLTEARLGVGEWHDTDVEYLSEERIVRIWSLHGPNADDEVVAIIHPKGRDRNGQTLRGQVYTDSFASEKAFQRWQQQNVVATATRVVLRELVENYQLHDWGLDFPSMYDR